MEKEFLKYKQALALKELGFNFEDYDILGFYSKKYGVTTHSQLTKNDEYNPAPLYQQAFRWFREKYNILLDVVMFYDENQLPLTYKNLQKPKGYFVWDYYDEDFSEDKAIKFYTHEEAESACLDKLIEIVKNK